MRTRQRRGMLLLVVLALLAMFAMMTVAFVVMTSFHRDSAQKIAQVENQFDPPDKLLNDAVKAVVTGPSISSGTAATTSAITWQSLLEKIDGFETIGTVNYPCTLSSGTAVASGQLIEFTLPQISQGKFVNSGTDVYGLNKPVDPFHCVGCVLTMLDGPAAGLSTRIVGINPNTQNLQMVAFEGGVWPLAPNSVAHYIINGFPYSGMGYGFTNSGGSMTSTALVPNAPPSTWLSLGGTNGIIAGGVNSDYTAPDYQDPLLALAVPDGSGGVFVPIPSMQRSELIPFWIKYNGEGIKQVLGFRKEFNNCLLAPANLLSPRGCGVDRFRRSILSKSVFHRQ